MENHFSPLDFIMEKIMLDLNVLRPVMEHRVLCVDIMVAAGGINLHV
jgi:hypothetical protein